MGECTAAAYDPTGPLGSEAFGPGSTVQAGRYSVVKAAVVGGSQAGPAGPGGGVPRGPGRRIPVRRRGRSPGPAGHPRWEEPWSPEGLVHGVRLSFVVQQERGPAPRHRQRHGLIRPRIPRSAPRLSAVAIKSGGAVPRPRGGWWVGKSLYGCHGATKPAAGGSAVPRGLVQVRARGWGAIGHETSAGVAASVGIRRGRRRGRRRGGREEVEGRHAAARMRLREEGGESPPRSIGPKEGAVASGTSLPRTLRHADFPSPLAANKGEKLCCQTALPSLSSSASTSTMILP